MSGDYEINKMEPSPWILGHLTGQAMARLEKLSEKTDEFMMNQSLLEGSREAEFYDYLSTELAIMVRLLDLFRVL